MTRLLVVCLGLAGAAAFTGCSPTVAACGPATCASGCCDASGACVAGNSPFACGANGQVCQSCVGGQQCLLGACFGSSTGGSGGGNGGSGGGSVGGGGGGVTGGGSGGGGGPIGPCGGSLSLCGSACVDLQADENNCGVCGRTCSPGQVCDRGNCMLLPTDCAASGGCPPGFGCNPTTRQCEPGCQLTTDCPAGATCSGNQCACPAQQHACGNACVSNASPESCGASCTACAAPANATPTCDGTACSYRCNAGFLACGTSCVACTPPANATAICGTSNTCDFACNTGYRRCGTGCVPTNAVTCGASCTPCATDPHGTATCSASTCAIQCSSGFNLCGGACAACPTQNATSFTCAGSTCQAASCTSGARLCGGACATCPANATATACQGSACVATACAAGTNLCGGACKANTDITACGQSCAVCTASSGMTPLCVQGRCDARCNGTTTCKGQCGATCTWSSLSSTTTASSVDVLVDAQGGVNVASVSSFKPSFHRVSAGTLVSEPVVTTNDCFVDSGGYSVDSAPILITDPASPAKPGIACPRGNTMNGYRWSGGAWAGSSIFSSTSLNSSVLSVGQSNGTGAFGRYMPSSYGNAQYVNLLTVDAANGWTMPLAEQASAYDALSAVSLLATTPSQERVAYASQTIQNYTAIDAGSVRIGQAASGAFTFTSAPWVVADAFAQDRDGTVVAFDRGITEKRLVNGAWVSSTVTVPSGAVYGMDVLVDPAGIIRIAWGDASGVFLASKIGGTWIVERVSTLQAGSVRVSVNASGTIAIAGVVNGTVRVFE